VTALHRAAARIAASADIDRAPGAVQSVPVSSPQAAVEIARRLYQDGVVVGCFRPPSVPDGISRIRLTARATVDVRAAEHAAAAVRAARGPVPAAAGAGTGGAGTGGTGAGRDQRGPR
jgi:8-amino-7-oxononanoate synthase